MKAEDIAWIEEAAQALEAQLTKMDDLPLLAGAV